MGEHLVRLIVFGRQGAGKGTQCSRLAAHYGVPHISTGDMLREAADEGTDFGRKAKELMDRGELLPDDIMLGVIHDRLEHDDVLGHGFILDGFPRTVSQAESLLEITPIDCAVNLEVPEEVVLERIASRRQIEQRDDDVPASVTARLDTYRTKTLLAVAWMDSKGHLVTVNGVGDPDEVFERLRVAIDSRT